MFGIYMSACDEEAFVFVWRFYILWFKKTIGESTFFKQM